jgi:serine phosphatase RsbU (regulator of sigma subunit)
MRALADVVPEPAGLLRALERHVPTIPDALCATVVYAVVDPAAAALTYVRAGHLPPLLLHPDASAELLDREVSPPLGVKSGVPIVAATHGFEPGDTLVLYTDGVVERRGEPLTVGLERLRVVATAAAGLDPEDCCDRIVAEMLGDEGHGDDVALMAVRLERVHAPAADPEQAPTASRVP